MEQRIFALLGISPKSNAEEISEAYWARVRVLRDQGASDLRVAGEIDELNLAYQQFSRHADFIARSPSRRKQPPRWRTWAFAGALVVVLAAGAIEGLQYHSEIADAGTTAAHRAQSASDRGVTWVQEQFATPTPSVRFLRIANTGGTGAWVRVAPSYDAAGVVLLHDGATLAATGDHATVAGERWLHVRTPAGADGWISEQWLAAP